MTFDNRKTAKPSNRKTEQPENRITEQPQNHKTNMIHTTDLSKKFDDFLAVDGINLNVPAGGVLALLGPNGAGKTTTVRMLTALLQPSRGRATVAGYDVVKQADNVRAAVGVLTEMHGLYNRMPADEYLNFFGELYRIPLSQRHERIHQLLHNFGLTQAARRPIGEYSKGMRQKLALARALIHQPPVLLLDEPTSAMDPESARLVRNAIHDLRSGERAVIICTHNLAEAEELADQIAIIRHGRIVAQGTPNQLKMQYLGPAEYEIRLATSLNGSAPALPAEAQLTHSAETTLRFRSPQPERINPQVLAYLQNQNLPVISLQEVPRSLESVYLRVMSQSSQKDSRYA
ncbi:MAG: ABC transporter ATP-binding protein [Anaerolineales bacterium]